MKKFADNTLRQQLSTRGGGVEIDLSTFGFKGHKMSAYQNYLGGGMLGRICVNHDIPKTVDMSDSRLGNLARIGEELKEYFHGLTNPNGEWESQTYEQNQKQSISAY